MLNLPDVLAHLERLTCSAREAEGVFRSASEADTFARRVADLRQALEAEGTVEPTYARLTAVLFPGLDGESLRTSCAKFVRQLGTVAERSGASFRLVKPAGRGRRPEDIRCHFAGRPLPRTGAVTQSTLQATAGVQRLSQIAPRIAALHGSDLEEIAAKTLERDERDRPRVKLFVSYTRKDSGPNTRLLGRLRTELALSRKFAFELWQDTRIPSGAEWHEEILENLWSADFCLALVSPGFLVTDYIIKHELPPLVKGDKPFIPVSIEEVDTKRHDLRGLEPLQFFRFQKPTGSVPYDQCHGQSAKEFAARLAAEIEQKVEGILQEKARSRLFNALEDPAALEDLSATIPQLQEILTEGPGEKDSPAPKGATVPTDSHPTDRERSLKKQLDQVTLTQLPDVRFQDAIAAHAAGVSLAEVEHLLDGPGARDTTTIEDPYQRFRAHQRNAVQYLREWLGDPNQPPFAAVLGEIGSGKTTMLQMFARAVALDPEAPPVIFVDLRDYQKQEDATLEGLLVEYLRRHAPGEKLNPDDLLHAVRHEGGVIIFDGLDEKIISMSEGARQRFVRELWRVLPPDLLDRPASEGRGRLIISCRSHYFPDVQAQSSGYTDQDRGPGRVADYVACILLPWLPEQIESYLEQALGRENVATALETIATVHNLTDLARRPYLLSLLAPELEGLQRDRAAGRPINAAALYQKFITRWLHRDDGKHVLEHAHKLRLMESLAADLWRNQAREWPWPKVDEWLDDFFHGHPKLMSGYVEAGVSRQVLKQDFRTATFFLRPDACPEGFRFAHTSLQEYFLAAHLARTLGDPGQAATAWNLPLPSLETCEFLGQTLQLLGAADRMKRIESLRHLISQTETPPAARQAALRYLLVAHDKQLPVPENVAANLRGLDLTAWEFRGTPERPLRLARADFTSATLIRVRFNYVQLPDSRWAGADLCSAEFLDCDLARADFHTPAGEDPTRLEGARLRGCVLAGANLGNAPTTGLRVDLPRWDEATARRWRDTVDTTGIRAVLPPERPLGPEAMAQLSLGHNGSIRSVAFSPDGHRLVSGASDGTVRLWETATGTLERVLKGHTDWVLGVKTSPDCRRVVSGGADGTVRLWDAITGELQQVWDEHQGEVFSVAFSPDGQWVISGSKDGKMRLWNIATGALEPRLLEQNGGIRWAGFSPDSRRILSGGTNGKARMWDVATGRLERMLDGHIAWGHSLGFSCDGHKVVTGGNDGRVRIWNTDTAMLERVIEGHLGPVRCVAFSSEGHRVVSGGDDRIVRIWDATTGALAVVLKGHISRVHSVGFSPDDRRVVSSGEDGTIRLWDAKSGSLERKLAGHETKFRAAANSTDRMRMASGGNEGTVFLWDGTTGDLERMLEGHSDWVRGLAFSPDNRKVASVGDDRTVRIWDATTGKLQRVMEVLDAWIQCVAFSPDGRQLASGANDGTVRLWTTATGALERVLDNNGHEVQSVNFSPDGRWVVGIGRDGTVQLWDAASGHSIAPVADNIDWLARPPGSAQITPLGNLGWTAPDGTEFEAAALPNRGHLVLRRRPGGQWRIAHRAGEWWRYVNWAVDETRPDGSVRRVLHSPDAEVVDP